MQGRKPKPTKLKELHGNPGKRPLNECEPRPDPIAPEPPSCLGYYGRKEWNRIVPELEKLGLISRVDMAMLASYCALWETVVRAEKKIKESPDKMLVLSPSGYPIVNPYIGIRNSAIQKLRAICAEFGFTPSSRGRITLNPREEESEVEEFLDKLMGRPKLRVVGNGKEKEGEG